MNVSKSRKHCPEVENLMEDKTPFITRHGITVVAVAIMSILAMMLLTEGNIQQLAKGLIKHTKEQITSKYR